MLPTLSQIPTVGREGPAHQTCLHQLQFFQAQMGVSSRAVYTFTLVHWLHLPANLAERNSLDNPFDRRNESLESKDVVKRVALQSALLEDGHFTA